jgi:hypothetical protein
MLWVYYVRVVERRITQVTTNCFCILWRWSVMNCRNATVVNTTIWHMERVEMRSTPVASQRINSHKSETLEHDEFKAWEPILLLQPSPYPDRPQDLASLLAQGRFRPPILPHFGICLIACISTITADREVYIIPVKVKGKVVPIHGMKVYMSRGIAPLILNLDTRWRWEVNFTPRPLYLRKNPWFPMNRRMSGPQSRSGRFEAEKISCPSWDSKPR